MERSLWAAGAGALRVGTEDRSPYDPPMPTTLEVDDVREVEARTAFEQRVEWKRQVWLYRGRLEAFARERGYRSLERWPGAGHCSKRLLKPSHRCTVMGCYESEPIWLNQLMDHREWLRGDGRWAVLGQPYDVNGLNLSHLEEWCEAEGLTLTVLPTSPYSDCCMGLLVEGVVAG
jgi:hypothetical protein